MKKHKIKSKERILKSLEWFEDKIARDWLSVCKHLDEKESFSPTFIRDFYKKYVSSYFFWHCKFYHLIKDLVQYRSFIEGNKTVLNYVLEQIDCTDYLGYYSSYFSACLLHEENYDFEHKNNIIKNTMILSNMFRVFYESIKVLSIVIGKIPECEFKVIENKRWK